MRLSALARKPEADIKTCPPVFFRQPEGEARRDYASTRTSVTADA